MKICNNYLTKNPCYVRNYKRTDARDIKFQENGPQGLMLHSVGCAQPSAMAFCVRWDSSSYSRACVHAFIDAHSGTIRQTLPWNYRGWHAGKNAGNNRYIGVEMCESGAIKYISGSRFIVLDSKQALRDARTAYKAAVDLFAYLCALYEIDPLKGILSHAEGHSAGVASNHGDPEHYWRGVGAPYTMDLFRADVKRKMEDLKDARRVITPDGFLNVRKEPDADAKIIHVLRNRQLVKVLEDLPNGWCKVSKPTLNLVGYVNGKYLR